MTDQRPPYHRRQTKPLPRAELAPISAAPSPDSTPTLEPCPACADCEACGGRHWTSCPRCGDGEISCEGCKGCALCFGAHAVEPCTAAEWRTAHQPHPTPPRAA
jgi:hypothetical protein